MKYPLSNQLIQGLEPDQETVFLSEIESILQKAPVVYGQSGMDVTTAMRLSEDTHSARLICIEDIRPKDTAESLLREIVLAREQGYQFSIPAEWHHLIERAKKLLEGE